MVQPGRVWLERQDRRKQGAPGPITVESLTDLISLTALLISPLALLMPAPMADGAVARLTPVERTITTDEQRGEGYQGMLNGIAPDTAYQVRIEQRMTIRIAPRPMPMVPNMLADLPEREVGPRFSEHKMGKCVTVSRIAGVQTGGVSRLILFMRDQSIVSAQLERACRARDFYSGFYVERSNDGQICVDRDTLLSRSGANCKLTRLRQLVEMDN